MEIVNERRKFVKGIGFFAALLGGGAAAGAVANGAVVGTSNLPDPVVTPVSEPVVEDISHLAPPADAPSLQITGSYGEKPEPKPYAGSHGNMYYFQPLNPVASHSVAMAVGHDNRLWIKVGEEWKRVALEG